MSQSFEMLMLLFMLFCLMLGMGATLTLKDFREVIKRPKAFIVGVMSQYGWMPLVAFGLALLLDLPAPVAVGLILLGCTPGGTTSNLFTYFSKGDLALSISMTVTSTFLAVFLMPTLLFVYAKPFTSEAFQIPYARIAVQMALVLVPVAIGMYIRSKSERVAKVVEKVGSTMGLAVIAFVLASWIPKNSELLSGTGWGIYAAATFQACLGFVLGFGVSRMLGIGQRQSRTVSLETGLQNTTLTLSVLMFTFPNDRSVLLVPMIFAFLVIAVAAVVTYLFRVQDRMGGGASMKELPEGA